MSKYFIITVDTEGDNLWDWIPGTVITTNNINYIERFQLLCNKYDFKPVYLSNYEMLSSDNYIDFAKKYESKGECEIGLHLHAWNNPPLYELKRKYDQPSYLIEYPYDIMKAKFKEIFDLFVKRMGKIPISHRAGRWAMNSDYFNILKEFGIKVDCSYTPHVDWSNNVGAHSGGVNYKNITEKASFINGVFEVPMTIRKIRWSQCGGWKHILKSIVIGSYVWLRPASSKVPDMISVLKNELRSTNDFVEFMIHSSELMPGGSPYYKDEKAIENLYQDMEKVFSTAKQLGFKGATLEEYYNKYSR